VALAEDRDRRADAPDESNRCYAEKAPRRRDLIYQSEYCYTTRFASCTVFLAWAARNAAEPAYVSQAAQRAWGSGVALPEMPSSTDAAGAGGAGGSPADAGVAAASARASGFGWDDAGMPGGHAADPQAASAGAGPAGPTGQPGSSEPLDVGPPLSRRGPEQLDWVSASAWADAAWDPEAEEELEEDDEVDEVDDAEAVDAVDGLEESPTEGGRSGVEEALQGPRVPAALPLRRRRPPTEPIRTPGSGEWLYGEPAGTSSLESRGGNLGSPILLAVLGLLVVALIVFLVPTLLGGRGGTERPPTGPSPSVRAVVAPTRAPTDTPPPSAPPSPTREPRIRSYTVKAGDTLSAVAAKAKVNLKLLQCINGLVDPDVLQLGQELLIPPDGYTCPPGWRRGTQAPPQTEPPEPTASPRGTEGASLSP
jgi:LysM repeat protein